MEKLPPKKALPKGVLAQRENGLYSFSPRTPLGQISAEYLNIINTVVQEYNLPSVRLTAGQKLKIQGIPEGCVDEVIERLGPIGEFSKCYVQTCPGKTTCRLGMQDSMSMADKLEKLLNTIELPWKFKAGVSGCSMSCSESYVRDLGLVGKKKGWTILFGGNAGKRVRIGDILIEDVGEERAFEVICKTLDFYCEKTKKRERTARFVERVGLEAIRDAVFSS
ncbi:nitrite/sulfite reductase domain-containing protein [Pseudodesulfovibrio piezophilus]|uniref:Sulfite reductase, assimilatory-type n=1 Tax=Pseudodesulfovibrio piezophilus (strain DSM 21447 / JCM 15486 / C1TLV30) TaxID=1322246 RepID=M1WLE0_PSEP2|nr:sulfite reductase [Pseudodesulfovibrio piezophilus]CCH47700.1 Sulfite reductase, assimilatory-type [Pseudodesulfovibrio piezophilus C1TLV30]